MKNFYRIFIAFICIGLIGFSCSLKSSMPSISSLIESIGVVQEEYEKIVAQMKEFVATEIATPTIVRDFIEQVKKIEQFGNKIQKKWVDAFVIKNRTIIRKHIVTSVKNVLTDPEFHAILKTIIASIVIRAIFPLTLTALQIASGNVPLNTIIAVGQEALVEGSLLGMIKVLNPIIPSGTTNVMALQALKVVNHDVSLLSVPLEGIRSEVISAVMQGVDTKQIIHDLDWQGFALGQPTAIESKYQAPVEYVADKFEFALNNKQMRQLLAQVLFAAVQGSIYGVIFYYFGLGFFEEVTVVSTLSMSAVRGAILGLINYLVNNQAQPGVIQNVSGALMIRHAQQIVMLGGSGLNATDLTPAVLQQIATSAAETAVNSAGGWSEAVNAVTGTASVGLYSRWSSWTRGVKNAANKFINWLEDDIKRSAQAGAL